MLSVDTRSTDTKSRLFWGFENRNFDKIREGHDCRVVRNHVGGMGAFCRRPIALSKNAQRVICTILWGLARSCCAQHAADQSTITTNQSTTGKWSSLFCLWSREYERKIRPGIRNKNRMCAACYYRDCSWHLLPRCTHAVLDRTRSRTVPAYNGELLIGLVRFLT